MKIIRDMQDAFTRNWWAAAGDAGGNTAQQLAQAFVDRVEADGGVAEAQSCLEDRIQELITLGFWDQASAVWLPHGYKEDKLYAVKGGSVADFTFSRAGTRTRTGSANVEYVPYNLYSFSQEIGNSFWSKNQSSAFSNATTAPDGTLTADKFVENGANTLHYFHHSSQNIPSTPYTASVYIKSAGENRYLQLVGSGLGGASECVVFNPDTGTVALPATSTILQSATMESAGNGWYRCVATIITTAGATPLRFQLANDPDNTSDSSGQSYQGDNTSGIYVWGMQWVHGTEPGDYFATTDRFDVPALDYSTGECPTLSLEEARTNRCLHSEDFSNAAWGKVNVSASYNSVVAPDGTRTADRFTATGDASITQVINVGGVVATHTVSLWMKSTSAITIACHVNNPGNAFNCNLTTEWQRFTFSYSVNGANATLTIGNGTSFSIGQVVDIWGVQYEQGSNATSYIPTTTAMVSRVADSVSDRLGLDTFISQTQLTLYFDGDTIANSVAKMISINNGTNTNTVRINFNASNQLLGQVIRAGVTQASVGGAFTTGTRYKVALTYQSNKVALFVNGSKVGEDLSVTPISQTLNQLNFHDGDGNFAFNGNINGLCVFDVALSDAEAISLTTL